MENILVKKLNTQGVGRSPISDTEKLGNQFVRLLEQRLLPIVGASVSGMLLDAEVTRMSTIAEGIPVPAMLGVLAFKGSESRALINISADLVFHIVDLRMGGDPETCPTSTTRSFTSIDNALLRDVLDEISNAMHEAIALSLDAPLATQFELTDVEQNITNVSVAPDNADVLNFSVALDIGDAARGGDFDLALPLSLLDVVRSSTIKRSVASKFSANDIWRARMKRAAAEADIPLTAIIHRSKYQAQFLEKLEVGQVLRIKSDAPQNVELTIRNAIVGDIPVATTKLGAYDGRKVVKLTTPPNPDFISYLIQATEDA